MKTLCYNKFFMKYVEISWSNLLLPSSLQNELNLPEIVSRYHSEKDSKHKEDVGVTGF